MESASLSADDHETLTALVADLRRIFGERLRSVAAYGIDARHAHGGPLHAIALVERLTFDDLSACAPLAGTWSRRGLDVPLLLEHDEFTRTLDVFPLEYGDIIARHVMVEGPDPFAAATVPPADLRRAVEQQAKSHLIHLREGYLESGGDPRGVAGLIAASAPAWHALLVNIARLSGEASDDLAITAERQIGISGSVVRQVLSSGAGNQSSIEEPTAVLARYIEAAERVWEYVDTWRTGAR
jgi:hypothetical protein